MQEPVPFSHPSEGGDDPDWKCQPPLATRSGRPSSRCSAPGCRRHQVPGINRDW